MALGRIYRGSSPQIVVIKSAFMGYIPTSLLLWKFVFSAAKMSFPEELTLLCYCFIVYNAFAYTYFHFFNMSETARRIRVIYEIYRAGSLCMKDILYLYKTSDVITLRLKRLVSTKQLKIEDGYYSLNKRLLYYAALFINEWRNLLGFNKIRE